MPRYGDVKFYCRLISKASIGQRMGELVSVSRDRFLKPGGRIIPLSVELLVNPIEAKETYAGLEFTIHQTNGLDFCPAQQLALYNISFDRLKAEDFLADAQPVYTFDAFQTSKSQHMDAELRLTSHEKAFSTVSMAGS